jgi:hypothetical protein
MRKPSREREREGERAGGEREREATNGRDRNIMKHHTTEQKRP